MVGCQGAVSVGFVEVVVWVWFGPYVESVVLPVSAGL